MKSFVRKTVYLVARWILLIIGIFVGLIILLSGPLVINHMFLSETSGWWNYDLAYSAGEMLQYYGAVLGGLVMCFAIITTIHINNKNRRQDMQRQQFERNYALYHKLPEILTKLELAAIHVQYSVSMYEDRLMNTLDTMKESENMLREHHFTNDIYYSDEIESLLKEILIISERCGENVELYLHDKKIEEEDLKIVHKTMEDAFIELRESIKNAKIKIMAEINQFVTKFSYKG